MTSELLNISGKLDDASIHVIEAISEEANNLSIPYLLVGAAARDMLMHHYYGVAIQRVTEDVDFAVDVADWESYQSLRDSVWTQPELIDHYDGDIECVAAQFLGRRVAGLANTESTKAIERVFSIEFLDTFCSEMSVRGVEDFDENYKLMAAFMEGFNED